MIKKVFTTAALAIVFGQAAWAGETPSAPGAEVYFVMLNDGDTLGGPVKVIFGLSGMGIAPAGIEMDNTGHHHLLLNRVPFGEGSDDADMSEYGIYADDNHLHFGKGQTETILELPAGTHTLQVVLGDYSHVPHDPVVMSEQITVTITD